MEFAGRGGVGSTAVPRGCCKRWLGAPILAAPGREPRRGSRCGGAIAARRRVGSRAAPSDPAREGPASVPDAAPTLRGASAIWGKTLVRRFLHSSTSRRRELCWNLVGWREGGESPMCGAGAAGADAAAGAARLSDSTRGARGGNLTRRAASRAAAIAARRWRWRLEAVVDL